MEEAEKMAALKKAYADIILNTAKEAAARIMASERKALRFQQDLFTAKEEALNMLLRFKQIMDSKIAEAEITSWSQRRSIEELELQLNEAEEIVRDLRAELKGVRDELEEEKLKNNPVQPLDEQIVKGNATSHEDASEEHRLNTYDTILFPSGPRPLSMCDMKNTPLNQNITDYKCCLVLEHATTQIEPSRNSPIENYCTGNSDLASMIMQSKEPELYRNGCTQRIRAFERNLVDGGKLPLPGQADDQCLHIKTGSIIREDEIVEGTCTLTSPKTDDMSVAEKNLTELQEVMQNDSCCDKGQAVKFFRRYSNRRRKARHRNTKATPCRSHPDQVMKTHEPSFLSRSKTCPYLVNSSVEHDEDPLGITEDELSQKDSDSHVDPWSGCVDSTGCEARDVKAGSVKNVTNKDPALTDESVLTSQESKAVENLGVPDFKMNIDSVDVPSNNSETKDAKTCETTTLAPTQVVNDRLLKYTFRRKRKKEPVSSLDEDVSLEKNTTKRTAGDKQSSVPEPQKSSLIMESSRDSRRLVQVARQLISLSEKRWQ